MGLIAYSRTGDWDPGDYENLTSLTRIGAKRLDIDESDPMIACIGDKAAGPDPSGPA